MSSVVRRSATVVRASSFTLGVSSNRVHGVRCAVVVYGFDSLCIHGAPTCPPLSMALYLGVGGGLRLLIRQALGSSFGCSSCTAFASVPFANRSEVSRLRAAFGGWALSSCSEDPECWCGVVVAFIPFCLGLLRLRPWWHLHPINARFQCDAVLASGVAVCSGGGCSEVLLK
ncbi:hypothetical protein YC2023_065856 [Brassica napus]